MLPAEKIKIPVSSTHSIILTHSINICWFYRLILNLILFFKCEIMLACWYIHLWAWGTEQKSRNKAVLKVASLAHYCDCRQSQLDWFVRILLKPDDCGWIVAYPASLSIRMCKWDHFWIKKVHLILLVAIGHLFACAFLCWAPENVGVYSPPEKLVIYGKLSYTVTARRNKVFLLGQNAVLAKRSVKCAVDVSICPIISFCLRFSDVCSPNVACML